MDYYGHHLGDCAVATDHLTFINDSTFSGLLRSYYAPQNPLLRVMKVVKRWIITRIKKEKIAVAIIIKNFFSLTPRGSRQSGYDQEITCSKNKQNQGGLGSHGRFESFLNGHMSLKTPTLAVCERIAHQTPDTRHQIPNTILHTPDKHQNNGWKNKKISLKAYPCRLKKNEKNLPRITYATSEKPVFYDRLEKHPQCYAKQVRPSGLEKVMLIDPLRPNPGLLVNQESAHRRSLQGRSRPDTSRAHPLAFGQYSFAATPALDAIVSRFRQAFVSRWRAYLTMPKMRCAEHW